ncbi:uncharacterized protein LOC131309427 [Rhododendron vialii]|uniref:uncharacterized protein LOC131309427 n=1 Tax=Rhododendron vialii TaxID=182163 RepID=UPI00265EB3EC|nr:uncharacterized protein LOC131309427 [Rhododendron vialii]
MEDCGIEFLSIFLVTSIYKFSPLRCEDLQLGTKSEFIVMDSTVMFICKYGLQIFLMRLSGGGKLKDVLSSICSRWKNLSIGSNCDRINTKVDENEHSSRLIVGSTIDEVDDVDEVVDDEVEYVDGMDPAEKYCKHTETRYLTEAWANLIKGVGQEFPKGCEWKVHAILNRTNGVFHIKKCHNEHNCGSTYRTNKHKRVLSRLVANEIAGIVEKKSKTSPIDMQDWFTDKYGLDLCYHNAWLGVEKARGELYGDYEGSFDRLRWYVEAARATNPRSVLRLESDPVTKEFSRLFVSFDACIKGFNYCRPFLCLDATHLKGRFKGTLLAATEKDANQCLFPIAYAICDAENDANWTWFIGLLRSTLSTCPITFITDRNAGLVNNIPIMFPGCHHAYCLYHLQFNLKDHFPGRFRKGFRNKLVELFNKCAYASSVSVYKAAEEDFYQFGGDKARTFIASVPKEHWSNAYFKGQRYDEMSSSAVESFNNWILKAREMAVFYLVDELRRKIMKQMAARRVKSMKWNSVICPNMDKKHTATVIIKACGGEGTLVDHMDPLYLVDAYRRAYEEPIYPVVESDIPDFTKEGDQVINPPRNRQPAGRPKVKRVRSKGEESYTRPNKCGRYTIYNHDLDSRTADLYTFRFTHSVTKAFRTSDVVKLDSITASKQLHNKQQNSSNLASEYRETAADEIAAI